MSLPEGNLLKIQTEARPIRELQNLPVRQGAWLGEEAHAELNI
ncbi:hypothetical protein [Paenibacillus sonchi]|nr:hypothetical protein [Paenibacillus sonchi]